MFEDNVVVNEYSTEQPSYTASSDTDSVDCGGGDGQLHPVRRVQIYCILCETDFFVFL